MGNTVTLQTLLGVIFALIPATVLLTLVVLWLRGSRRRGGATVPPPIKTPSETLRAVSEPLSRDTVRPAAVTPLREAPETVDAITRKIERATARGEKTSLSALYFDLAAAYAREGNFEARMTALRSAAGEGALHGPHAAHAAARLALAEAAHQAGDLTSACEQWQLARMAFQEGGDEVQHARVEKRMRENGCPTDWVLTDF